MRGITELTTAMERTSRFGAVATAVEPAAPLQPAVDTMRPVETLLAELDVHVTTMAVQLQPLLDALSGHHDRARTVLLNRLDPVLGQFFG